MRFSAAYYSLLEGIAEVERIERHALRLESLDPVTNAPSVSALVRGGIVLLSSHLEAYAKSLVEILLVRFHARRLDVAKVPRRLLFFGSQDIIREIRDTSDPEKVASKILDLISRDGSNWVSQGPLSQEIDWSVFEPGFASPKVKNISKFLSRVGYAGLRSDLAQRQMGAHAAIINAVDHLVDTRNAIAHGDQNEKKTPLELRGLRESTRRFCRDTDDVFANWCKANLCTIR